MVSLMSRPMTRVFLRFWANTRSGNPAAIAAPPRPRSFVTSRRFSQPSLNAILMLLPGQLMRRILPVAAISWIDLKNDGTRRVTVVVDAANLRQRKGAVNVAERLKAAERPTKGWS